MTQPLWKRVVDAVANGMEPVALPLLSENSPELRGKSEPFDFENPPCNPDALFRVLKKTMTVRKGVGLAAPQCGIFYRVFVFGNPEDDATIAPAFNPKVVDNLGSEEAYVDEGCLSFPGLFIKIKRSNSVRCRYTNQNGFTDTVNFGGYTARVFQHEFDHLDGILFTGRANGVHRARGRSQRKALLTQRKTGLASQGRRDFGEDEWACFAQNAITDHALTKLVRLGQELDTDADGCDINPKENQDAE